MFSLNSWTDLIEKLLPGALAVASQEDVEFRKGLPRDLMLNMGVVHEDKSSPSRKKYIQHIKTLMKKMIDLAPLDAACGPRGQVESVPEEVHPTHQNPDEEDD